jgi:hypothetical protein
MTLEAFAVLSALGGGLILIPLFHILLLRLLRNSAIAVRAMFICFGIYLSLWAITWHFFVPHATFRQYVGGLSTTIAFCLTYMQFFSLLCRGFSIRLVLDIFDAKTSTLKQIIGGYNGGRGPEWLIEKRIRTSMGFLLMEKNEISLSGSGRIVAKLAALTKSILNIGAGGW